MSKTTEIWPRPLFQKQESPIDVAFFVFSEGPLDLQSPIERARFGVPTEFDLGTLDVRQHLKEDVPNWFEGFITPEMLTIASSDVGDRSRDLPKMNLVYSVHLELEDAEDLGYLQACWGFGQWLCDRGAEFVLDAHANRWHLSEDVTRLEPLRAFDFEHEVKIVLETDPTEGFGHVAHTRGMAKFGRPDLLLLGAVPEDFHACGVLLNGLAKRGALGAVLKAGQTVSPNGLSKRQLVSYEPEKLHPQVHLNNEGLLLDILGWGLARA